MTPTIPLLLNTDPTDDADGHITVMAWPVERVAEICAAMMRAVGR